MNPVVSTSPFVIFLVILLSLLHILPTAAETNNTTTATATRTLNDTADIQKACSLAKDKPFCVKTLQSNPKSRGLSLKDLSSLAMTMAQDNGTATLGFVSQKLGDENELQASLDESLRNCEGLYQNAVAMLENAMSASFAKGKEDVTKWLSAAMVDARSCEDGVRKSGGQGVMGNRNQVFYKLVSNAWSVYDAAVAGSM